MVSVKVDGFVYYISEFLLKRSFILCLIFTKSFIDRSVSIDYEKWQMKQFKLFNWMENDFFLGEGGAFWIEYEMVSDHSVGGASM